MGSFTYDQLTRKFELLSDQAKQEAYDFIDFLSQKKNPPPKNIDKQKVLLGMSCWRDEDVEKINQAREHMNQ